MAGSEASLLCFSPAPCQNCSCLQVGSHSVLLLFNTRHNCINSIPYAWYITGIDRLDKDLTIGQMQGEFLTLPSSYSTFTLCSHCCNNIPPIHREVSDAGPSSVWSCCPWGCTWKSMICSCVFVILVCVCRRSNHLLCHFSSGSRCFSRVYGSTQIHWV